MCSISVGRPGPAGISLDSCWPCPFSFLMCLYVSQASTTAITPATEPTTLAIIVILLSLLPLDEPVGDAIGDVDVEVGAARPVFPIPPGAARTKDI